jgi:hypothetical protein
MLAMRQIMLGPRNGAGWQNPYVTDGLVAMWDGIWNVGGGQEHDNSSKIWWDCIGGKPIVLMSSKSAFSNLGVAQSAAKTFTEQIVGGAMGEDSSYGWRFAEYVITLGSVTSNTPYVLAIGRRGLWLNVSGQNIGVTNQTDATWHSATAFSAGSTFSVSADYNSAGTSERGSAVWFNAASIQHTGGSDGWNTNIYSPYAVGAFYNVNYPFVGTYHAIRLYNRALTQSEIDANHAVDKERFNLP